MNVPKVVAQAASLVRLTVYLRFRFVKWWNDFNKENKCCN